MGKLAAFTVGNGDFGRVRFPNSSRSIVAGQLRRMPVASRDRVLAYFAGQPDSHRRDFVVPQPGSELEYFG